MSYSEAVQLRDQIAELLPDALVTLDATDAGARLAGGQHVIIVQPPAIAWPTWTTATDTWQLVVVAGVRDRLAAWQALDGLLETLREPLALDTGEPAAFQAQHGNPWPAYLVTCTTSYNL